MAAPRRAPTTKESDTPTPTPIRQGRMSSEPPLLPVLCPPALHATRNMQKPHTFISCMQPCTCNGVLCVISGCLSCESTAQHAAARPVHAASQRIRSDAVRHTAPHCHTQQMAGTPWRSMAAQRRAQQSKQSHAHDDMAGRCMHVQWHYSVTHVASTSMHDSALVLAHALHHDSALPPCEVAVAASCLRGCHTPLTDTEQSHTVGHQRQKTKVAGPVVVMICRCHAQDSMVCMRSDDCYQPLIVQHNQCSAAAIIDLQKHINKTK